MSYITAATARSAAGLTTYSAAQEMRKSASAPLSNTYDIFLSHASEDADVIAGLKAILEREGVTVYVYWAEEDQAQRVTPQTAATLRQRMQNCRSLVYASSKASPTSKWMPWELGYFDGHKPNRVAVLPIVSTSGASFAGQEYLGLYPYLETINWTGGARSLGILTAPSRAATLREFVQSGVSPR